MSNLENCIPLLRCPECAGAFEYTMYADQGDPEAEYGVLTCNCFRYPVVDSVPVLLRDIVGQFSFGTQEVESDGPPVTEVVALIEAGQGSEALVRCLSFSPHFHLLDRLPVWRLWHNRFIDSLGVRWVRKRVRAMLSRRDTLTAEDLFEFYFGPFGASEPSLLSYYRNRFSIPRTLAALAMLRLIPASEKPVLDMACGFGPFAHMLTQRSQPVDVIGFDFNFYLSWGQKHLIAPRGTFLCADGARRLPFKDDAFSVSVCSDAFTYLPDKQAVVAELNRCTPDRPIVLTRVSNLTARPNTFGDELSPQGYLDLLAGGQPRVFGEYELVRDYLDGRNPFAEPPSDPQRLHWDKWLTLVMNPGQLAAVRIDEGEEIPHGVGRLTINPMYELVDMPDGQVSLQLDFPTIWFAYQNGDMYAYHGDRLRIDREALNAACNAGGGPQAVELTRKFFLIGLPARYLRSQLG